MKYLFFIVSIVTCLLSNAQQVYFNKIIRTDIAEQPQGIVEDDSCYYAFGLQLDSVTNNQKLYFYKLDKLGNLLKYNSWGSPYKSFSGTDLIETSDGNLAGTGTVIDTIMVDGMTLWHGLLTKFTKNGDTLWQRNFYDTTSQWYGSRMGIHSLQETYDKGFILSGWTIGSVQTETRNILIKTDSLGYGQWYKLSNKHIGYEIYPWSLSITSDTGYIVAGSYWNGYYYDGWLYKTDQYGNSQWEKFLGGQYDDWIESAIATSDGNIACVLTDHYDEDILKWDISRNMVCKFNLNGGVIWQKYFYNQHSFYGNSIIETHDQNYLVLGKSYVIDTINNTDGYVGVIYKLDNLGNQVWMREFFYMSVQQGFNEFNFMDMIITDDQGILICGDLYQIIPYTIHQSSWFVKLDSNGCDTPNCQYIGVNLIESQPNLLMICPNPVYDEATVMLNNIKGSAVMQWELYYADGRLAAYDKVIVENGRFTLPVSGLPTGCYLLRVTDTKGGVWNGKIVKE